MKKVKVALYGYGHLGKWHAEKATQLHDVCELVAIVEPRSATHDEIMSKYPGVKVVSDGKEIVSLIDAALIVTPTSYHYETSKNLLENKKHVFCEKPITSTSFEAKELIEIAKQNNLVLQVGHSERFHQAWDSVKGLLVGNNLKKIIRINRLGAFKGRAVDVDVVQDLMIHDIDLLLYLFEEKPISVSAKGYKLRTKYWDHVIANFTFSNGSNAIVTVGRNYVREVRDLEIFSPAGCTYVDLLNNTFSLAPVSDIGPGEYVKTVSYPKRDHLLLEQEAFYKSIIEKIPVLITGEDGLKAVNIIEKVLESLPSEKEVFILL